MSRALEPCGTPAAHRRHYRRGEKPCEDCAAAMRRPRELMPCGTRAAYARHLRRGEVACRPCRDANTARTLSMRGSRS